MINKEKLKKFYQNFDKSLGKENFVDNDKIFQGYHMNKNNWITIKLDDSIETQKIFKLIDNSYKLSLEN